MVEIACPSDCPWLASAREHPPAAAVRRQRRDLGLLVDFMHDFNERQSQLFFLITTFLNEYRPAALQAIVDDDVAEAVEALASTYETAARGVIYEHRPSSLPAGRLLGELKPLVAEAGKGLGSSYEREAAIVLRRVREAASHVQAADDGNRRAFLDFLRRVLRRPGSDGAGRDAPDSPPPPSSLIVP